MATWSDLMTYIRGNYKISDEGKDYCGLGFDVGNGRKQVVVLFHHTLNGGLEHWVEIESPVGNAASLPLLDVLKDVGRMVVGGLIVEGDLALLRHSVPLANLDVNEFERPMRLLRHSADDLEKKYLGTDRL